MVGNDDGVTGPQGEGQILANLPGILAEAFPHVPPEDGVGAGANFGITVKQPQSSIGYRRTRAPHGISGPYELPPVFAEEKLGILIVRAGGTSLHIDLIVVIFTLVFKQRAELEGMVAANPRETVRHVKDGAR